MMDSVVAKRYAEALFQLAEEKNITEQLMKELGTVKEVFQKDEKTLHFLNHPRVNEHTKIEFIDGVFKATHKIILNTLKLLVERNRLNNIVAIVDQFIHLYNEANGIAEATVYSVRPLTNEEKESLEQSFTKKLNKKHIKITNEIDETLLGGLRIQVGNTIYDGTISGNLARISQRLTSANV